MPPVLPSAEQYLLLQLAQLAATVQQLSEQQQILISNSDNVTRIVNGLIPGSGGLYGFQVLDTGGNNRVQVGDLPGGDIGLSVSDPTTGTTTTILPVYKQTDGDNSLTTSSTTYVTDPNMPALTATIGAHEEALILLNSYVGIPGGTSGTQSGGFVGLSIDGGAPTGTFNELLYFANTVVGSTAVGMAANQSASFIATGLSSGQHTFEMQFKMTGPGSVTFESRYLQVQPL